MGAIATRTILEPSNDPVATAMSIAWDVVRTVGLPTSATTTSERSHAVAKLVGELAHEIERGSRGLPLSAHAESEAAKSGTKK